jgi:hypothetical protein
MTKKYTIITIADAEIFYPSGLTILFCLGGIVARCFTTVWGQNAPAENPAAVN